MVKVLLIQTLKRHVKINNHSKDAIISVTLIFSYDNKFVKSELL